MEGLKVSESKLVVYLHPSKAQNVSQAILSELSSHLFKFNETFDGVLLAYEANSQNILAKILTGIHPYFCKEKVVKLGEQSIHVVVLGFASATIVEEDIRDEFNFKVKHGDEVFVSMVDKNHKIKVGSFVHFIVKSFDEEILHISGSLLPIHTGSVRWLKKTAEDCLLADSNIKKGKASRRDVEILAHEKLTVNDETPSFKSDNQVKNSKRRKSIDA